MRAADKWDSARFSSLFLALSFSGSQASFPLRPLAANASRWVANAMKKYLKNSFVIIFLAMLLASCGKAESIQTLPTHESQSTPTIFPASYTPTSFSATLTATETPYPTTPVQATIAAHDSLCVGAKEISMPEISPNGKWIAALCYWENGKEASPLQVVSLDRSKEWKIYYRDYAKDGVGDHKDGIMPYRWSKDEKFLYVVAGSRFSGCCWIGGKYVLLVRLNLETGRVEELLNTTDPSTTLRNSFTISEDDHYLLFTPVTEQPYDIAVLDLLSAETRVIKLEESKPINLDFAVMSPYKDIIVLPLFKHIESNDYVVESLALIDLKLNEQRILVSDLKEDEELYPIRWIDEEHVLISSAYPGAPHYSYEPPVEYWSININTGERKVVDNP